MCHQHWQSHVSFVAHVVFIPHLNFSSEAYKTCYLVPKMHIGEEEKRKQCVPVWYWVWVMDVVMDGMWDIWDKILLLLDIVVHIDHPELHTGLEVCTISHVQFMNHLLVCSRDIRFGSRCNISWPTFFIHHPCLWTSWVWNIFDEVAFPVAWGQSDTR